MPTASRSFSKRQYSSSTLNSSLPSSVSKGRLNRSTTTPAYAIFNDSRDEPVRHRSRSVDSDKRPHSIEESDSLPDRLSFPSSVRDDEEQKLVYASLPSTPIASAPPGTFPRPRSLEPEVVIPDSQLETIHTYTPFTLWDYLREELFATDFDSHQELKWERVSNFLGMPLAMEKIIGFGFILCFDSFLYTFTILPIRFAIALSRLIWNILSLSSSHLPPSQKADLLRMLLLVLTIGILVPLTDASKIYHSIRGQDTIKLYVIFNALEVGDRLCASIGQDILDCLFSRSTLLFLSHRMPVTTRSFRPIVFFALATLYNVAHSLIMVYQLIALNVAVNSYDHALLTLLVSNQFVEIKGSVFKKFEKDNLFQITCADIVERFTLALMLVFIGFRNLIELSGSEFSLADGFVLPKSFGWFRGNNVLWTISYPVLTVMLSEMLVDWLKHAFITKFNHIRPSVYERYTDVLCQDLASGSAVGRRGARKHDYVDQSPLVARRLGFPSLPLAVVTILVGAQSLSLLFNLEVSEFWIWDVTVFNSKDTTHLLKWVAMGTLFWLCFLVVKVIMGIRLISYAARRRFDMEKRAIQDRVNDFGRDPIGESKEEQQYNRQLKTLLVDHRDDVPFTAEIGENPPEQRKGGVGDNDGGKKKRVNLEELTRFTMVKRIW